MKDLSLWGWELNQPPPYPPSEQQKKAKGQTKIYFSQRESAVMPGPHVYSYPSTHAQSNTTTGDCGVSSQLSYYNTGGSLEESGGWAKWRQAAGRKPFTQTLNKVPLESFQLPAEEE